MSFYQHNNNRFFFFFQKHTTSNASLVRTCGVAAAVQNIGALGCYMLRRLGADNLGTFDHHLLRNSVLVVLRPAPTASFT